MFFRNGSKFTLSERAKASAEAPSLANDSTSVAAGVREIGSISRFPANTAQGDGVQAAEAENTMWFVMAYVPFGGWIDGWMAGWMGAVSREIRLAGTTPAAV